MKRTKDVQIEGGSTEAASDRLFVILGIEVLLRALRHCSEMENFTEVSYCNVNTWRRREKERQNKLAIVLWFLCSKCAGVLRHRSEMDCLKEVWCL